MKVYDVPEKLLLKNFNKKLYDRLIELGAQPRWAGKVDPNLIITDQGIYPREKTDLSQVDIYAADMEKGDQFPTVIITMTEEGHYLLVDGNHRTLSARKAGVEVNAELWDIPQHLIDYVATIANTIGRGKQGKDLTGSVKSKKIIEAYTTGKNRDVNKLAEDFETSVSYVRKVLSKAGVIKDEKEEEFNEAKELYEQGYSISEIAKRLNKDKSTISRWVAKFTQVKNATPEENQLSEKSPSKNSDTDNHLPQPNEYEEEETYTEESEIPPHHILLDPDEIARKVMEGYEEEEEEKPKKRNQPNVGRPKEKTFDALEELETYANEMQALTWRIVSKFGHDKAIDILNQLLHQVDKNIFEDIKVSL